MTLRNAYMHVSLNRLIKFAILQH